MSISTAKALNKLIGEGLQPEPVNQLNFAGSSELRRASKARSVREMWVDSRCDYLMTFIEFRQQSKRNKILKSLGREPLYLPGEARPGARSTRRSLAMRNTRLLGI